jgi:hypothetical protein
VIASESAWRVTSSECTLPTPSAGVLIHGGNTNLPARVQIAVSIQHRDEHVRRQQHRLNTDESRFHDNVRTLLEQQNTTP